jgi:DNA-binding MarR family transcriptional regulator
MIYVAYEFLDQLFWKLHRILDKEGVSVLQWAIMLRSYVDAGGVPYSAIRKATGQTSDNVRRAAEFLQASKLGKVIIDPKDKRARIFILNTRGKNRARSVNEAFKADLLVSVGAREIFSKRARLFTRHMWLTIISASASLRLVNTLVSTLCICCAPDSTSLPICLK